MSLWLHSQRTIEADDFSIQHGIVDDGLNQLSVLLRFSEALWEWHSLSQEMTNFVWKRHQHWSLEQTGRNGDDSDSLSGQVPGDWQGHADDRSFGRRIRSLSNLTVIGSNRCSVYDNSALAVLVWFVLADQTNRQTNDVESSDSVDVDDSLEVFETMRESLVKIVRLERNANA